MCFSSQGDPLTLNSIPFPHRFHTHSQQVIPAQDPDTYHDGDGGGGDTSCPRERKGEASSAAPLSLTQGLVFIGLFSLVDPPRLGVVEAVHKCRWGGWGL